LKILITGAAGQSGSAVLREFARRQIPVRALVRDRARALSLESLPGIELVEGDMSRPETLSSALESVERALLISSANPKMVETQCAFIDAAKSAGVRYVVKFSGQESNIGFDSKKFRFARMHEEIEQYLEQSGVAWSHLRPSQFMQMYLRETPTIVAKSALFLPLENVRMSPVDQQDIAQVACAVLTGDGHEGKAFEMTGPEALNMDEVAERISEAIGKKVNYVPISAAQRREALAKAGTPAYTLDALDEQGEERRRCPESRVYLGTHEEFGVRPTTFAEFAREHAGIFRGDAR
jgi:uncharacterized protein YbjT (DUF2867 family)